MKLNKECEMGKSQVSYTHSSQPTVKEAFVASQPLPFDHPRARKLHRSIAEMICVDCLPFYTVEKPGFLRLVKTLEPKYTPCSRTYLSQTMIPSMYEKVKNRVSSIVQVQHGISITTDIWSSDSHDSYLSFTCHWINENWEYKEACLHAQPFNERHTGENIATTFTTCMNEWHVSDKVHLVVRDGGSNFVAGFRNAGIPAVSCFAHSLQLVVKDGILAQKGVESLLSCCRKIVGHFRHSNISMHALTAIQAKLQLPQHKPIQDEPTRWNSSYYMLCWLLEQKQAILAVGAEITLPVELSSLQWQLMAKVVHVLKPFEEATKEVSFSSASIAIVIPMVNAIIRQLEMEDEDVGVTSMKRQLLASLASRFSTIESTKHFVLASVLDPRYKLQCFTSSSKSALAKELLLAEWEISLDAQEAQSSPPKRQRISQQERDQSLLCTVEDMIAEGQDSDGEASSSTLTPFESEVQLYLTEPNLPLFTVSPDFIDPEKDIKTRNDPLLYWRENASRKPKLALLAKKYLSAPPGSVASERLFSTAADIADEKRNRLAAEKVEMLLFLKKNLQLLNFDY